MFHWSLLAWLRWGNHAVCDCGSGLLHCKLLTEDGAADARPDPGGRVSPASGCALRAPEQDSALLWQPVS